MPNVGPLELVVVLIIALVVLGPKRLPEVGRSLGKGMREFKDSLSGMRDNDDEELRSDDVEEAPKELVTTPATAPASPADAAPTAPASPADATPGEAPPASPADTPQKRPGSEPPEQS